MASEVSKVGEAFDIVGRSVEIGQDEGAVYLNVYGRRYLFEAYERDRFIKLWAEAERRAEQHQAVDGG